ncbi:MAG: hypothetical protein KAH24_09315 [Holophagae bacterium]|nr:hypothetical protein [Holophagae bacterium]
MQKYYTENQIYVATFLGGPVPAGILIYQNLKKLGETRQATAALLITGLFTFLLFYGILQIPAHVMERIPSLAFTTFYTVIVFFVYRRFLADRVNSEIMEPGNRASNWSVAGYTFLGLIINMVIIFAIGSAQPAYSGEKITFGSLKHELYYDEELIDRSTVEDVTRVLTQTQFFDKEYQKAAKLELSNELLVLVMNIQRKNWSDSDLFMELANLKKELQTSLRREVSIELIHYGLNGEEDRKKI